MTGSTTGKIIRRRVDGVLLLDKPHGLSSNIALQKARRLYAAERAGHSGTLDPLATGLLPVLFGEATKFGSELLESDKRYRAEVAFGVCTTTGDAEGEVLSTRPVDVSTAQLEAVVQRFIGPIQQIPPMYSALKHAGRPLYDYARKGEHVARPAREITIYALHVEAFSGTRATLDVHCSKGTYIRTLAEDIGEALGCGAHLAGLRRTGAGPFGIDQAMTLEALEQLPTEARDAKLLPADVLVQHLPRLDLTEDQARRLNMGQPLPDAGPIVGRVRVYLAESFLGVGEGDAENVLRARRLLRTGKQ